MNIRNFIGIDYGGTKIALGQVNPITGIIPETLETLATLDLNTNEKLTSNLLTYLNNKKFEKEDTIIGICAAGAIDEENLIIKKSPNSPIRKEITFAKELSDLGFLVSITNDLAGAALGISRFETRGDATVATYSSGFNVGIVRGGKIAIHPELGHISYKLDSEYLCGCHPNAQGHLETFVSGGGAAQMAKVYFEEFQRLPGHPIISTAINKSNLTDLVGQKDKILNVIDAKMIYDAYRQNPEQSPQREIREEQVKAIAHSFGLITSCYNPVKELILIGSMTKDWDIIFQPALDLYHKSPEDYQMGALPITPVRKTERKAPGIEGAVVDLVQKRGILGF